MYSSKQQRVLTRFGLPSSFDVEPGLSSVRMMKRAQKGSEDAHRTHLPAEVLAGVPASLLQCQASLSSQRGWRRQEKKNIKDDREGGLEEEVHVRPCVLHEPPIVQCIVRVARRPLWLVFFFLREEHE